MKNYSIILLSALLFLGSSGCNQQYRQLAAEKKAKNIILLIGDGMGLAQASTAFYFQEAEPNFVRFPVIGLHQNPATDALITDSAAGATAFSTGYKSYNAAIGVDSDTISRPTILELAARQGKSTGLIATSSITHATPASFFAHTAHRNNAEDIAGQLPAAPVDFFAGGGLQYFNQRTDGANYLDSLAARGFQVYTHKLERPATLDPGKKYGYLLAPDGLPKMQEGRGDFLPTATKLALDCLSQDKDGFFLMVEGSQIDWGGHNNDPEYVIQETLDFDRAIGVALDFAEKDGNTLVVVTADHETGGMSLSAAEVRMQADYRHIKPTFSTGGHSASLIPVYAYGPGAALFMGVYQNNDIFGKMWKAFRLR
ncbi:MAG: alkaline phosphatase [Phaeodactylibacter sp.]|nr:alkaline phosphatase [Phaeodactylibacter sp.]MCB9298796.1 alkaline phosphatase [Lewinellaceae bacterium]